MINLSECVEKRSGIFNLRTLIAIRRTDMLIILSSVVSFFEAVNGRLCWLTSILKSAGS